MKLTKEQKEILLTHIGTGKVFYYIDFPNKIDAFVWKDGDGVNKSMHNMTINHLQSASRRIELDLIAFNRQPTDPSLRKIFEEYIIKPAEIKRAELEQVAGKNGPPGML